MTNKITQKHRDHIKFLEQNGHITPNMLLADAKRKDSPLHELFEWDKTVAAEQHWLDRAREIIRSVKLVVHTEFITARVPAYVRDPDAAPGDQGYVSVFDMRSDIEVCRRAVLAEVDRIAGNLKRARSLAGALGLDSVFEEMLHRLIGVRSSLMQPPITDDRPEQHVS